jgi:uncharacterized protein YcfL
MQRTTRWILAMMVMVAPLAAACSAAPAGAAEHEQAVVVEKIDGSDLSRLILSEKAAARLGVTTAAVAEQQVAGNARSVVPYSAVMYDKAGATWAYTNPEGRTFVRASITVDRIVGDTAILADGPAVGTLVVTVGAAELWGVETGVGGGH